MPGGVLKSAHRLQARKGKQTSSLQASGAGQICKMPQKALRGPKRPKSHMEILPHPGNSFLASKFPLPSWTRATCRSTPPHWEQIYPSHTTASQNFVDPSFAISQAYSFQAVVTSRSHHHPQTTATTKCLTAPHNGSHRTRLPPSYGDPTSHLPRCVQPR